VRLDQHVHQSFLFMRASETLFEQLQCADGRDDLVVLDEADGIERGDRHHLDVGNVARREEQLLLERLDQDQGAGEAEFRELPIRSLVRGAASSRLSTAIRRSWRTSSEIIDCIAARYILRLTFCVKSRGRAAKHVRRQPTKGCEWSRRGLPGAFLLQGFLPPPRTSARDSDAWSPRGRRPCRRSRLVHQRLVVRTAERDIRQLDFARRRGIF